MQMQRGPMLVGGLILFLGLVGLAYSQPRPTPPQGAAKAPGGTGLPLAVRLAARTKLPEKTVQTVLDALGPAVLAEIAAGGTDSIPRLGGFRVVRIPEHKDMERGTGRVLNVPGKNYIVFDPEGQAESAANAANVQPNAVVPPFEYILLPGQTPGQRVGRTRAPDVRTK
jgi:nucleoid DNA-binding protein